MAYYVTTPHPKAEGLLMTQSQEEAILAHLKKGGSWTAWDLKRVFNYEITSLRRALHDLTKEGKICQCGWRVGDRGKKVGVFKIFDGKLF